MFSSSATRSAGAHRAHRNAVQTACQCLDAYPFIKNINLHTILHSINDAHGRADKLGTSKKAAQ
jgi:hypothetical protein